MTNKTRTIVSLILIAASYSLVAFSRSELTTYEAQLAVTQVQDSAATYGATAWLIRSSLIDYMSAALVALIAVTVWRSQLSRVVAFISGVLANIGRALVKIIAPGWALFMIGCGPARVLPLEMVGPNETAFVIPLEGDTVAQEKFESVEFLNKHKVVTKRIEIPVRERSIGRLWSDYEWIPTVRVVKVDRSLVTREWSPDVKGSTALSVESVDSIGFHVGVNLTAFIVEEDAAKYLYFHNVKPLAEVVDQNVRGFLQDKLASAFGVLKLEECKAQKSDIFTAAEKATIEHFKNYGITISNIGNAGGLYYDDRRIQAAINDTANAEMSIQVAMKEKLAQDERNKQIVATAIAQADAAREFAKAKDAQEAKTHLDIERMNAEARLKWDGKLPANILPQGSGLLMDFGK